VPTSHTTTYLPPPCLRVLHYRIPPWLHCLTLAHHYTPALDCVLTTVLPFPGLHLYTPHALRCRCAPDAPSTLGWFSPTAHCTHTFTTTSHRPRAGTAPTCAGFHHTVWPYCLRSSPTFSHPAPTAARHRTTYTYLPHGGRYIYVGYIPDYRAWWFIPLCHPPTCLCTATCHYTPGTRRATYTNAVVRAGAPPSAGRYRILFPRHLFCRTHHHAIPPLGL